MSAPGDTIAVPPDGTAAVTVIFRHLDPTHEPAVRAFLAAESLLPAYFGAIGDSVGDALAYDEGYGKLAADLTACARIADALAALDPHAVFEVCQDPGVNFAGERVVAHPEYGRYRSAADENGAALITTDLVARHLTRIRDALARGEDPGPALDDLDRAAGGPWHRDLHTRHHQRHPAPLDGGPHHEQP